MPDSESMYLNLTIVSHVMVPSRGEGSSLKLGPAGLCVAYGAHRVSNVCGSPPRVQSRRMVTRSRWLSASRTCSLELLCPLSAALR